jgi:transcriptional regulator with GAF, ATPase, and Fis domain
MIPGLLRKIQLFDKENLMDVLHHLSLGVAEITGRAEVRVYMENMREGALTCLYTPEGELERRDARVHIGRRDSALVRAFLEGREETASPLLPAPDELHGRWFASRRLARAAYFPLLAAGHAVGVVAVDAPAGPGAVVPPAAAGKARDFLAKAMPALSRAHRFHQQMMLSRTLDRSRKREAAILLLRGALTLDLSLDMASALVPAASPVPEALRKERGGYMQILAAASRDPADVVVYETMERIPLLEGRSLISGLVTAEGDGVARVPGSPDHLFYDDIMSEPALQRREVFERLQLRTLLMFPHTGPDGSVTCFLNYFTKRPHRYSEDEINLLRSHAGAVGRAIEEAGGEHFEIRVLAEIEQLLAEEAGLAAFLARVAAKACELIGADSGSIGLVRTVAGEKRLVVEEDGRLVGAKTGEWRKAVIPALRVGGEDLPPGERSLTGHVAHTGRPALVADARLEASRGGFYRELDHQIRSALAVPVSFGDAVVGVINLDSYQSCFFTAQHQAILMLISRLIGSRVVDLLKISELTAEVERLQQEVSYRDPEVGSYLLGNIIGQSASSRRLVERISLLVPPLANWLLHRDAGEEAGGGLGLPTVLITGETGSGKEFIFNNIFNLLNQRYRAEGGKRAELPLRKTNIAAYSGEMTYTELFGHRKGAYTGAHADRAGILEEADGGVVFLDEIGDADLKTQVQLLRFLDSGEFSRLGETRVRKSRVILLAATNRDLGREIAAGAFREDLYHRLSEFVLPVTPLRERREDIPDLARHFLGRLQASFGRKKGAPRLSPEALELLTRFDYPGNIRQLVGVLQRSLFLAEGGGIGAREVGLALEDAMVVGRGGAAAPGGTGTAGILARVRAGEGDFWKLVHDPFRRRSLTREQVAGVYREALAAGRTVTGAARLLGVEGERDLVRFRNFIYKTIGIAKERER